MGAYAHDYLRRADLRESTQALYAATWRLHLSERWADVPVGQVTPHLVRTWHEEAARSIRPTALVHAYRLLRALLAVAVDDEAIAVNPARLRGAGTARSARASRSLTAEEVSALADAVPPRYRALVLVMAYGALRFGEATALRRCDVSADGSLVTVERSVRSVGGRQIVGPPKTDAGRRAVALPPTLARTLARHLEEHVGQGPDALVFSTGTGGYLARSGWTVMFQRAVSACGLPPVRSHELRHTGATLAAATGATTEELMARLGHASSAAALLYQHAASHRDAEIASALDALLDGSSRTRRNPR
ncbi:tyrosine-type recombinase/integrase [Quadrisphaera sp. DSM 44207]|uniref:tyrosine-type recombinase/integrase n=1 Tax=Quadrisphaera sp. DSM 44207 TaxID=1881057 RepID=UPI000A422E57|nr:tyrosine-type recombinase/integrase [Quadrisphaera sp. DSM 44207]